MDKQIADAAFHLKGMVKIPGGWELHLRQALLCNGGSSAEHS